ncbi:MAG: hypothetical protein ACREJ2_11325 [Planctomycetota bacterium]
MDRSFVLRLSALVLCLVVLYALPGAACSIKKKSYGAPGSGGNKMFVVTTDYTSGSYATVDASTHAAASNIAAIDSDAVARVYNGLVWVINRTGENNITVVDPTQGYAVINQFTTNDPGGPASNPQDIEFVSLTKAYITRYEQNTILIVNPSNGAQLGTINLSSLLNPDPGTEPADTDGIVEMAGACIHNATLYVTVERLDRANYYTPVGHSYIAVIDTATDTLTGSIQLTYANPSGDLRYIPSLDRIATVCSGSFGVADGAIEMIDPTSNTDDGAMLLETSLNGDFDDFVVDSATQGYVLYNDFSYNLKVQRFNPTTLTPSGTDVVAVSGFNLSGLALTPDGKQLYVGDRTGVNPGIRIYDTTTSNDAEITTNPIPTGLPPFEIDYVP